MPLVAGTIDQDGAVVGVLVSVSNNRRRRLESVGFAVPGAVPLRLQIDTGSFVTALMPQVFQQLELSPFDVIPVRTPSTRPGHPHLADQYDVSLTMISGMTTLSIPSVFVIASDDFDVEGVQGIIGRDILDRCNLMYLGPEHRFELAF
jgi:hypothetical protein